ncbi:MAG: nucleotidyltransferase domain-containing protein [Armatimonadetes bacterium]|nr:nucleotidyltransferase domain-containing protein [Armatimonadota bacterium]
MNEAEAVDLVCQRMCETFAVHRVLLFGSRGRGEAREDSDLDVLVIADSEVPFVPRQAIAYQAMAGRQFSLDLVVCTPAEFEAAREVIGSTAYWADREGKLVYAAA